MGGENVSYHLYGSDVQCVCLMDLLFMVCLKPASSQMAPSMSTSKRAPWTIHVLISICTFFQWTGMTSEALMFHIPALHTATCGQRSAHGPVGEARTASAGGPVRSSFQPVTWHRDLSIANDAFAMRRRRYRGQARRTVGPTFLSFESGTDAADGGNQGQALDPDGDMGMAPVDLDQAMGSFSPDYDNSTAREDPRKHLIKGSVIQANQTVFPYSIDSFPPLANSEVYYNGTSERYWWNQNSDAVSVYVPVSKDFDPQTVEFEAKTKRISLRLDGEEIISGTPFYRIDGYESVFIVDKANDPPYVQLELYKVREYQNWEDFLMEQSTFTPGGAQ